MIPAVRALLDVLFASIWQDAIVAFCVLVAFYAVGKRLNAATRHVALQAALIAMIIVPIATTLPHLAFGSAVVSASGTGSAISDSMTPAASTASNGSAISDSVTSAATAASNVGLRRIDVALPDVAVLAIAALWLAGTLVFLLRIALGLAQLARFVRRSERLADRGGAQVYASETIPVPVAFGLLRPAIVVPTEIMQSGGEELECVLLHELAHVRRRDAWLHTFERLVHAVFFFNPAVALLLQSIALERESACDDWAVAHSHDASIYTHCLAALAVRTGIGADAPAACGAVGHEIVDRIERLQDQRRNRSLLLSPFALGGIAFMLVSIALSLQLLAPAIAFSPQTAAAQPAAASPNCTRDVSITYPVPPPQPLPAGVVDVKVLVSPTGTVTDATIAKSSGNAVLDSAALNTARKNGYAPAMRNCKAVAGSYLFRLTSAGGK